MKHCVLCKFFAKHSVSYREPVDFEIYDFLPPKIRQEICEGKRSKDPVVVFHCEKKKGVNYTNPEDCKTEQDCMTCSNLFISKYDKVDDLPKWLVNRKEEFTFPLIVVYCSKKKKSSPLIIWPNCDSFELKDE